MKHLLFILGIVAATYSYSQNTIYGNLEGTEVQFIFSNNSQKVSFCADGNCGEELNVVQYKSIGNNCYMFVYIAEEEITVIMCEDNSLAASIGKGRIIEGYWIKIKDNYK